MNEEEIEKNKKLFNIAKEWLITARWEGNVQSLVELILSFTEPKDKRIEELEKENAVLKERNIKDCKDFNRAIEKIGEHLNQKQNQLTKAKEIIKTFLGFAEVFSYSPSMDKFISEAEQFLKDLEK